MNNTPLEPSRPEIAASARRRVEDSEAELKEQEEQDRHEEATKKKPWRQSLTPKRGRPTKEGGIRDQFPSNIVSVI